MSGHDEVTEEEMRADLVALKRATTERNRTPRGTPEWTAAFGGEQRAVARVRRWSRPGKSPYLDDPPP